MPSILKKKTTDWLHPTSTKNRFAALSSEEPTDTSNFHRWRHSKATPIYESDVITIPPLLQLLDQTAFQLYEIKALVHNQVKIQPKTPYTYRAIIKAHAEKNTSFHTFKPKEERSYRVNIFNIKHRLTKLPFSITCTQLQRHLPSGIPSTM
jgi:hypothetical protein